MMLKSDYIIRRHQQRGNGNGNGSDDVFNDDHFFSLYFFFSAHRRHPYKLGMMLKHLHTVIYALAFVHRTRNVAEKPISYILFCCFIWMRNRLPRPTVCSPVKVGAIIMAATAEAIAIAIQTATAAIITQTNAKLTRTFPDTE